MIFLSSFMAAFAQSEVEKPEPVAEVTSANGNEESLEPGGTSGSLTALPVIVKLHANAEEVEGYSLVVVWTFTHEGEEVPYLTRYDDELTIELQTTGTVVIQPQITYTSTTNSEIVIEYGPNTDEEPKDEEYIIEPFRITIAESSLKVPNAFSPNGDGVNDDFKVYNAQSIVSFSATILNRWGQKLYSWNNVDDGWDGTYNGRPVKAGVYYVVVIAKGADGIEYEFRRDVNLLRGYTEGGE